MTNQELNRDIKRLYNEINKASIKADDLCYAYIEQAKKEFTRLYYADRGFQVLTKQSILIMLHLNLRFRIVPLHTFGIYINL